MKTDEFFSLQGRKLLITNRVKTANRLKRIYNKESYDHVTSSLHIKRAVDVALELVNADRAMQGKGVLTFISSKSASVMFHQMIDPMIRDGKIDFIPKTSSGLQTSAEVYRVMNELCMGCRKEPLANDKAKALMERANQFENSLLESEKCNEAMCLRFAVEVIENTSDIEYLLPWLSGCALALLETDKFRYEEKVFIDALAKKLGASYETLAFLKKESYESKFVKAYGLFNEVSHVADEIENGTTPYGNIAVYYMHEDYVNMLRMIFERRGIPVTFSSGIKCTTTNIIQFMLSVLDFYEHDFDYGMFMKIAYNPISKTKADDEDKRISFSYCYRYATSIGWGKERYAQYLNRQKEALAAATDEDEKKKIKSRLTYAEFMNDIVNISNEEKVGDMYSKLVEFTLETAYKNPEKKLVSNSLRDQIDFFNSFPNAMELKDSCNLIRDCLQSMKYSESEDTAKVNAVLFSDFEVVERSKVFFLGLSAKYVSASSAESPVLSDKELESCIDTDKGYVKLAKNSNKDRKEYMENTLRTVSKGTEVTFSYPKFDTVELRDRSCSVFYLDHKGDSEELTAIYDVPDRIVTWDDQKQEEYENELTKTVREEAAKKEAEKNAADDASSTTAEVKLPSYSSTALHELLSCPYSFYYHYKCFAKIDSPKQRVGYQWLAANERGTLFHLACEVYLDKYFPHKQSDNVPLFDKAMFDECFNAAVDETKKEVAYPDIKIFESEKNENYVLTKNYMSKLLSLWKKEADEGEPWINIANEAEFEDVRYHDIGEIVLVTDDSEDAEKKENVEYTIYFKGSIDRLDGYVDNDGILHLRIVDYKTGKKDEFEKEVNNYLKIQHYVYLYGAYNYIGKHWDEIKSRLAPDKDIKEIVFDSVEYHFPLEKVLDDDDPIVALPVKDKLFDDDARDVFYEVESDIGIPSGVVCQKLPKLPDKVRTQLDVTEGLAQTGKFDEIAKNISSNSVCLYCDYKMICRRYL